MKKNKNQHRTCRKIISVILAVLFMVSAIALPARAEHIITDTPDSYGDINANRQDVVLNAVPIKSYLLPVTEGYMRVSQDSRQQNLLVQYFTPDLAFIRSLRISYELPLFGGFYASKAGNYYILSGQKNPEENDELECFRVIKFDRNWNRISSMSVKDCNTVEPFGAGTARFAESGDILYVHTCHIMYEHGDGLHHQANFRFALNMNTMTETFMRARVSPGKGDCSHSFNQFAATDGDQLITVDHGDAFPRSIVLCKYYGNLSSGSPMLEDTWIRRDDGTYGFFTGVCRVDILKFYGESGQNETYASEGGLAVSDSGYLVVGNTGDQSDNGGATYSRERLNKNVFLAYVPKKGFTTYGDYGEVPEVKFQYLTNRSGEESFSTPQLVDLMDGTYLVLWSHSVYKIFRDSDRVKDNTVYYQLIDGEANILGPVNSVKAVPSDCQPILSNGKVIWFTNNTDIITTDDRDQWTHVDFYTIDPATAERYVDEGEEGTMYRMYNPNSGEHFYTASFNEAKSLQNVGWRYEGHAWMAPSKSKTPVYRLYNPNSGEHHYTKDATEKDNLVKVGWKYESIGWYSDDSQSIPLYRLYNPNASGQYEAGSHHYTKDVNERNSLVVAGWEAEGIGWYGQ